MVFGKERGKAEFAKPFEERHPVVQWCEVAHKYMNEHQAGDGAINTAPMTGLYNYPAFYLERMPKGNPR